MTNPLAMRALFRLVGAERMISGLQMLKRIAAEPESQLDNVRDYVAARDWGIDIIEGEVLPAMPRHMPSGHDRDQIDLFRRWLEDGRPLDPILITDDGLVMIGWHRAVAARETGKKITAFMPRRMRRRRKA